MKVLRTKCKEMDDQQLERVFDEAYNSRNGKAVSCMMPIMRDRGLADKDENGRIERYY